MHTIQSFITHLSGWAGEMALAEHAALKRAAEVVEKEAKSEFGFYQGAIGPFVKWEELADSTKADRVAAGFSENDPLLRSGKLRGTVSHYVHGLSAYVGSPDPVMVHQELGTATIPPRAVLGPALARKEKEVLRIVGAYTVSAMLKGSRFSYLPTLGAL